MLAGGRRVVNHLILPVKPIDLIICIQSIIIMIPKFINREIELEFLENCYNSSSPEFIVIYGRRRIGKTELIQKSLKGKHGAYFLASKDTTHENLNEFKQSIAEQLNIPLFSKLESNTWTENFENLAEFLDETKKTIIVIDEFSYLIEVDRAVPSLFQKIWDQILKTKNVMLILCGSSVSLMESEVLGVRSPLFGRRTGQWEVTQLQIEAVKKFVPGYNTEDVLKTIFMLGGIPAYLDKWDDRKTVFENMEEHILSKGRYLYEEADFLLKHEFREQWIYALILKKLSLGYNSLAKLYSATNMDKANLSKYLNTLENLHIIRHILPIHKRKGGIYVIIDDYFDFWFRFVYSNRSMLELGNKKQVRGKVERDFNSYCGRRFEYLVEKMVGWNCVEIPFGYTGVSKWWHKDVEIDLLVVNDESRDVLFMECKWKKLTLKQSLKILGELEIKAEQVDWNKGRRKEFFGLAAKKIESKEELREKGFVVFDLDDV